jgi:hypothetical protein
MPPALVGLKELLIAKLYQIDRIKATNEEIYFYQNNLAMTLIRYLEESIRQTRKKTHKISQIKF